MLGPETKVLKVGIELHRVISHKKLFCDCTYFKNKNSCFPSENFQTEYPLLQKINLYKHSYTQYCGYEKDDRPPVLCEKTFNKAFKIIKNIPGIKIPEKILFNRKHILDGSIPKGYQISAVIGYDGLITLKEGLKIKISRIYLEEDSCTYVCSDSEKIYDTARSGLPLLEIVTEPVVLKAEEVKELMQKIEFYLSLDKNLYQDRFCIRQDINVSAADRNTQKIEIKGVDSLSAIKHIFEKITPDFLTDKKNFTLKFNTQSKNFTVLRPTSSVERMHPQTDLALQKSIKIRHKDPWTKIKMISPELQLLLWPVIKNKNHLKKISRWIKTYDLKEKDFKIFINLCAPLGKKVYFWYEKYLKDECSLEGLKKNMLIKTYLLKDLLEIYQKLDRKEFYKRYKMYLPRSFKID